MEDKILVGAAKAAHEKRLLAEGAIEAHGGVIQKRPFPFHESGASDNAPIRIVRMWKPECPVDPTPELRQKDGTYRPNPRYTGGDNCQQVYKLNNQGVWDVAKCESFGHDPWHTVFRKVLVEDVVDPDTGEVTKTKNKIVVERRPNIVSITLNVRHSSGTELLLAKARGYKTIDEYGAEHPDEWFESPCEMRACTNKVTLRTERYGDFCSERHARLVAAEARGILRFVRNDQDIYQGGQDKLQSEWENQLEAINLGIKR